MSARIIPVVKRKQIIELSDSGKRTDGRSLTDYRNIEIIPGEIDKAEGSATVIIGGTRVTAGVKFEIGDPFPDTPNEGVMQVSAEFCPVSHRLSSSRVSLTRRRLELARVVDRGLRESKMLDTSKLCIEPGKRVWDLPCRPLHTRPLRQSDRHRCTCGAMRPPLCEDA